MERYNGWYITGRNAEERSIVATSLFDNNNLRQAIDFCDG
jgi:hypothetical protein